MDLGDLIQIVILAVAGGVGWGTLRERLKTIDRELSKIRENELPHIQAALEELPCRQKTECPAV